ncbi:hypothetical protein BCR42DRAFT_433694 [Absidia repens]|uniref:Uncharacterized protein n=1 Tax=Absidia repens TaxID=90262 RepID=A0A1X2IUC1_9FUNG|nr:hypothetical protein BCR42DRAFT_433694 [Absidia repens]
MKLLLVFFAVIQLCLSSVAEAGLILHDQWKVGGSHSISWNRSDYTQADTVSIFVEEDRSFSLGHAQALDGKLNFIVPKELAKFSGQEIHITAVFRRNFHLFNVESASVRVSS